MRVKRFAQEHNTMTSALTTRLPRFILNLDDLVFFENVVKQQISNPRYNVRSARAIVGNTLN